MHLQIPQIQINDGGTNALTLGILGENWLHESGENGENNRVQFILRINRKDNYYSDHSGDVFQAVRQGLKTLGAVSVSSQGDENFILFSLAVTNGLRNPQRFVKGIARKIEKALERAAEEACYSSLDDWNREYEASGGHKSYFNQG